MSKNKSSNGSPKWIVNCDCGNCGIEMERSNLQRNNSCGNCKDIVKYEYKDDYMIGICSNGKQFYFDKEDFEKIRQYNWCTTGSHYVTTQCNDKYILLHRLVMDAPSELQVDHINHNTLDNRKKNLRLATATQNNVNKNFKGYTIRKNGKVEVSIRINGKYTYLGRFNSIEEAKSYRNEIAKRVYGEFVYNEKLVNENNVMH